MVGDHDQKIILVKPNILRPCHSFRGGSAFLTERNRGILL